MKSKRYKTGVVIGKFYPPHRGHKYLIDTALSQSDRVTAIVCDKKEYSIPGKLRARWLREIHPDLKVMLIDDKYAPHDSKVWARNTMKWLGYTPEAVFTSENYGDRYARHMKSKHVLVDLARKQFPVSGTAVRENPLTHWEFLEPCVRAYFVKRICVLGAESTGTTTLAKDLAEHYKTAWVPEFGRMYWEGKMSSRDFSIWNMKEFEFIAKEQNRVEDELAKIANKVLICDTDAFATGLWHERYMNARSGKVEAMSSKRKYDLYLLTGDEIPFVQDGTRDGEHIRHNMHKRFIEKLKEENKNFAIISGSREERLRKSTSLMDNLIKKKPRLGPEYR